MCVLLYILQRFLSLLLFDYLNGSMRPACYSFDPRERDSRDTRSVYIILLYSWHIFLKTVETRTPSLQPTLRCRCIDVAQPYGDSVRSLRTETRWIVLYALQCLCSAYLMAIFLEKPERKKNLREKLFLVIAIIFSALILRITRSSVFYVAGRWVVFFNHLLMVNFNFQLNIIFVQTYSYIFKTQIIFTT